MPLPDQNTIQFKVWPVMLMLEGQPKALALLIDTMYHDNLIHKSQWTIQHTHRSRKDYANELRKSQEFKKRIGIGAKTLQAAESIERKCLGLGIKSFLFLRPTG